MARRKVMEIDASENCISVKDGAVKEANENHNPTHDDGHTHQIMDGPGFYIHRDKPLTRMTRTDWNKRAFTVGIGGPVGSGKTALVLALCKHLRDSHNICVILNDIFTREDWEFLVRSKALPKEKLRAVETGACPQAAIREDYSLNMQEVRDLTKTFNPEFIIIESGGDNLATSGDKIPRKGGAGITQSDLLVINKTDLAEAVGADLNVMERDAKIMRQDRPTIFAQAKHNIGVAEIASLVLKSYNDLGILNYMIPKGLYSTMPVTDKILLQVKTSYKNKEREETKSLSPLYQENSAVKEANENHNPTHDDGHTHQIMDGPGFYIHRDKPLTRMTRTDWNKRAFTVGIGGPVGSGKIVRSKALPKEKLRAVETGACPQAAIREDYSLNMQEVRDLTKTFNPEFVIIESGGGDKIPRKGGAGITQSDLLVINKTDLAEVVGADLNVMERDAKTMRQDRPTIFAQAKHNIGVAEIASLVLKSYNDLEY
ncbi:hypothetical protein KUTeg_010196 [Tegillarca granosa]|uniref:CobW/HypB/UreG nucleotide-binding domain-containing protein n=1 Tax=Tegillarca granosa TaxID=220873 RepID=A0ABQ9FB06_TEGGR|nr:hypothetical protein KUTeg_010196 [Tegillarca granosa]